MKQIVMNKWAWMLAVAMVCASCMKTVESRLDDSEEEDNSGSTATEQLKPASAYFDFDLTKTVTLSLDYGTWGGSCLFGIYTENPVEREETENETRLYRADAAVAATVFTDKEGKYKGTIEVPACTEKLYVVTTSPWLTEIMEAKIENGRASVKSGNYEWTNSRASTRLVENPTAVKITVGGYADLYSIVGSHWDKYGNTTDPNGIMGLGNMTADNMQQIYHTLLHLDNTVTIGDFATYVAEKMSTTLNKVENDDLLVGTDHVNCSIATEYTDENGMTRYINDAQIGLTFISEGAAYMSTLGYYYYKTDECPASAAGVKKFMVFPDASVPSGTPFGIKNWRYSEAFGAENAPVPPNTRATLLYENEDGTLTPDFPAGYTIGFFLIANSMGGNGNGEAVAGEDNLKKGRAVLYSNEEWNTVKNKKGGLGRYIALEASDGRIVYGLEDATDNINCTDLLFYIDCNPSYAISDPDRPKIEDDSTPVTYVSNTITNNYAFEDQWPTGGDYDLNDVIIRHERIVSKTDDNLIVKIEDRFTPIQPSGSAVYRNAFAVTGTASLFGAVTSLSDGVIIESETNSYILTTNTNSGKDKTFVIVRDFNSSPILETAAEAADWNPFVIVQYDPAEADRIEIHLPKQSATSKMREGLAGTEDDAYYIDKSNMYPFSICIPTDFTPAPERMRIDEAYPKYVDWVKSNGASNTDWYKHPSFK